MKSKAFTSIALLISIHLSAQEYNEKYYTPDARISFYSYAPLEDIEASSDHLKAALDGATGEIMFSVPIESFEFDKSLMQRHFNEQYMESGKFPDARFKGEILNWTGKINEETEFQFHGELTIHGVTRKISEKATITPDRSNLSAKSKFRIRLEDYSIKIPRIVIKNIAEEVDIRVEVLFRHLK